MGAFDFTGTKLEPVESPSIAVLPPSTLDQPCAVKPQEDKDEQSSKKDNLPLLDMFINPLKEKQLYDISSRLKILVNEYIERMDAVMIEKVRKFGSGLYHGSTANNRIEYIFKKILDKSYKILLNTAMPPQTRLDPKGTYYIYSFHNDTW